jgi:MerR family transcriptional regulator, heat shock protein HspR
MRMTGPLPGPFAFDDADYPAYTMGAAAEILGVAPGFLRGLGEHGLLDPRRSGGGHRRYSRNDLAVAARARQVVDEGITVAAACRIVELERELATARATIAALRAQLQAVRPPRSE